MSALEHQEVEQKGRFTVKMDPDELEALRIIATVLGTTQTEVLRSLLREFGPNLVRLRRAQIESIRDLAQAQDK